MAITFQKQIKKQRNLFLIFLGLILITVLFIWQGDKLFTGSADISTMVQSKKININLEILNNDFFKKLQPIDRIPPFEGTIGKSNPFIP